MLPEKFGTPFYFPDPHSPWQRGTNENTNGLVREYLPNGTDIDSITDKQIQAYAEQLNNRPRKCLGWKTPSEVFFNVVLHLIWQFKLNKKKTAASVPATVIQKPSKYGDLRLVVAQNRLNLIPDSNYPY